MNIGVISDTHGLLRPEAIENLRSSDLIIHAGDIGSPDIVPALARIAPVRVVRGNVDTDPWARNLPAKAQFEVEATTFFLIHNISEANLKKLDKSVKVVVFGHSHHPLIETRDDVLYFNAGSAGPRRFSLPISMGRLRIENGRIWTELITLPNAPAK